MSLPLAFPYAADGGGERRPRFPAGREWQYEPKWDGFRCLAFRDGDDGAHPEQGRQAARRGTSPTSWSRSASLAAKTLRAGRRDRDPGGRPALVRRAAAPGASRREPGADTGGGAPARLMVFDLLVDERGRSLVELPLSKRRERLEAFAKRYFRRGGAIVLSRATRRLGARHAGGSAGGDGDLDGVVAKRLDLPYRSGERDGMLKVKRQRTADCVVGGFRYASKGGRHRLAAARAVRRRGTARPRGLLLQPCGGGAPRPQARSSSPCESRPASPGAAPGGPSRWSTERSAHGSRSAPSSSSRSGTIT